MSGKKKFDKKFMVRAVCLAIVIVMGGIILMSAVLGTAW